MPGNLCSFSKVRRSQIVKNESEPTKMPTKGWRYYQLLIGDQWSQAIAPSELLPRQKSHRVAWTTTFISFHRRAFFQKILTRFFQKILLKKVVLSSYKLICFGAVAFQFCLKKKQSFAKSELKFHIFSNFSVNRKPKCNYNILQLSNHHFFCWVFWQLHSWRFIRYSEFCGM